MSGHIPSWTFSDQMSRDSLAKHGTSGLPWFRAGGGQQGPGKKKKTWQWNRNGVLKKDTWQDQLQEVSTSHFRVFLPMAAREGTNSYFVATLGLGQVTRSGLLVPLVLPLEGCNHGGEHVLQLGNCPFVVCLLDI